MEERRTLCDPMGYVVKNRSSSGCLIVRKKGGDGVVGTGSSSSFSRKVFDSRTENKRFRMELNDSTSSDEPLTSPHSRMGSESVGVCNGLSDFMKGVMEGSRIVRKRSREERVGGNEAAVSTRNGEEVSERQESGNVVEFDEFDRKYADALRKNCLDDGVLDGGRSLSMMGTNGVEREHDTGFRRHVGGLDRRKRSYIDNSRKFTQGEYVECDGNHQPPSYLMANCGSNGIIRVQGKNGVLRVMVNKKKKRVDGSFGTSKRYETIDLGQSSRLECSASANNVVLHPHCSEQKAFAKGSSSVRTDKKTNLVILSSAGNENFDDDDDSEDSGASMKLGLKSLESRMKTPMPTRKTNSRSMDPEDSDTSLKMSAEAVETQKSVKGLTSGGVEGLSDQVLTNKSKEGKVKRGSGTKKQKLREQIREMLLESGWTIDYRPRKNRDYLDAVYINPSGTAYWSIIKAYEALLKQLNDKETDARSRSKDSLFKPLPDEVLSQLTRKTKKKIEKQMKLKQTYVNESENDRDITGGKFQKARDDRDSTDSGSHEEKLSSFVKQGGKSLKNRCDANDSASVSSKDYEDLYGDIEKPSSMSTCCQERKSTKLSRCKLVVRDADGGPGSDKNGFVPYSGKRTLLSWLIDCGTVQLRQKVRYMNRKRTKVMLEGWITRDGIHCGCCSKILGVSKFEIHAGSKLHQPFQNIFVDSGASLLECQIDAWNSRELIGHAGYYSVDVDCDDPSDDTCGRCGDGGDLICCDGCPSTFHLSCLHMEMLPPGDWHCPNCTCKLCGLGSISTIQGDDATDSTLLVCGLCAKRYHKSCTQGIDDLSLDANNLTFLFCEKKCKQLFEQLLKNLGVKHELDSGYSWSLIHRTDVDSDTSSQGFHRMVESNSKLAIALSVMDECFFPIVDRRSGINLVNNVVYNCGSNLSRLNFLGFFTIILERGDEIISAASIRFHGTRLAEMPFIGTRHIYRHQGMCRRLFRAIELVLFSLKVERLIVPAVSGFTHTWTNGFGFTSLEEPIKHELKSTNMLVFPGVDMLQKDLLKQEKADGKIMTGTGKLKEPKNRRCIPPETRNKPEIDPSGRKVPDESENNALENIERPLMKSTESKWEATELLPETKLFNGGDA